VMAMDERCTGVFKLEGHNPPKHWCDKCGAEAFWNDYKAFLAKWQHKDISHIPVGSLRRVSA